MCEVAGWVCEVAGWVCEVAGWVCEVAGWVCEVAGWHGGQAGQFDELHHISCDQQPYTTQQATPVPAVGV